MPELILGALRVARPGKTMKKDDRPPVGKADRVPYLFR